MNRLIVWLEGELLERAQRVMATQSVLDVMPPNTFTRTEALAGYQAAADFWHLIDYEFASSTGYMQLAFNAIGVVYGKVGSERPAIGRLQGDAYLKAVEAHVANQARAAAPEEYTLREHVAIEQALRECYVRAYEEFGAPAGLPPERASEICIDYTAGWVYLDEDGKEWE